MSKQSQVDNEGQSSFAVLLSNEGRREIGRLRVLHHTNAVLTQKTLGLRLVFKPWMSEPLTSQTHPDHSVVKHLGDHVASVSFWLSKWLFKVEPQAFSVFPLCRSLGRIQRRISYQTEHLNWLHGGDPCEKQPQGFAWFALKAEISLVIGPWLVVQHIGQTWMWFLKEQLIQET